MRISIQFPNHQEALNWLNEKEIKGDKLNRIMQDVAMRAEGKMKELITQATSAPSSGAYPKIPSTGETRASIMSWLIEQSEARVSYKVGTMIRGAQLLWLNMGRGWVYPKNARALFIKQGKAADQFGRPIFRKFARPSPAHNILFNTASWVFSQIEQIVRNEIAS